MPVELIRAADHLRDRSLGWLAAAWLEHFCVHGPGDIQGRPLSVAAPGGIPLSDELTTLLVDSYALDEDGRRLYDSVFFSRPKGADKSGQAARIALFEAFGPCRFSGWARGGEVFEWMDFRYTYEPGEPLGRSVTYPFLRCMATEEGQTGNVYDAIYFNLTEGPLTEAFTRKDDVGLTRIYLPGGGEIRPSTASSASKDGGKETWTNFDETHLYLLPELKRMYATVRRNMAKRADAEPWSFESSTMYEPGRNSVAEESHAFAQRIREGKVRRPRMLFDHREAPADVDLRDEASLRAGLREAYGDAASYIDLDRMVSEIWDTRNDETNSRRYFLNQATAAIDAWLAPHEWDTCARPEHVVPEGAAITLGFDGAKSGDHSALIGCEVETGYVFTLGVWDPEDYDGEAPRAAINGAVEHAFGIYDVVGFYADRHPWQSYIDAWADSYGDRLAVHASQKHAIEWDMSGRRTEDDPEGVGGSRPITRAVEAFHEAVLEGALTHDGDPRLARHVYNARRRPNAWGITIGKDARVSPRKIDALAAAVLARLCRQDYLALPDHKKRRKKTGRAVFV
ncbi:MAG: Terminase [Dehalococcoidia bacterium]|nr:Terminase [Dehalococcoidia bacterium]